MEDCLLLLLLLEDEENIENREWALYLRNLRDSSDPFSLSENEFMKEFHLTRGICWRLIKDLEPHDTQKTSLSFTVRVLAALKFLGHGSYYKCKNSNTDLLMSQSSFSRSLRYLAELIVKMKGKEINFPTTIEEQNIVKAGFFRKFGIKGTIGAIDCTHIAIGAPPLKNVEHPPKLYFNKKAFYSINVVAVCDHRLCFTYLNPKFPGSEYDSTVWENSDLREHVIQQHTAGTESWLIGDQGFPLEPWLLTPVKNPTTNNERKYNKIHASARNCIDRAFGALKTRFKCLQNHRILRYSHDTSANIILICVILHNIMTKAGITVNEIDDDVVKDLDYPMDAADSSQYTQSGDRTRSKYISTL